MSANTLSGLVPTIYQALDVVSRELAGLLPAVSRDIRADRVAVGQTVRSLVTPALTAEDATPSNVSPNTAGSTLTSVDVTITKSRVVPFNINGEETIGLGPEQVETFQKNMVAQAIRTLVNEVEGDLAAGADSASRAYGTAGTTPFGTTGDMIDVAQVLKILQDNGSPMTDLSLVLNTMSSANLRGKQGNLFKVNEAGTDDLLRRGKIGDLMGFAIGESAQLGTKTKGTGASYLVNNVAGYAIGATSITVDTGTGTILAGDVITFAGDTNKYVVKTALAANVVVIQEPGLRQAVADNAAITVGNTYARNIAFHRGAIQLAWRAPGLPVGGDMADDRIVVTDPSTGVQLEFAVYRQYRQVRYEVAAAWGLKVVAPRHVALLLG